MLLLVVMFIDKASPVLYKLILSAKTSIILQEQDDEKQETTKKNSETSREKEFAIFASINKRFFHASVQTQHNTVYLNNYKTSFYALITTPPPDLCI